MQNRKLLRILRAIKRSPGIYTTDQVTGKTFAELIDSILKT